MMTVNEVSKLAGVSIRTLQYYDKIGLLNPTEHTKSGYRLYDNTALKKLQQILLFRELEIPLKEIKEIVARPGFDKKKALEQQIAWLVMKKEHIENLIDFARKINVTGGKKMDFSVFDTTKIDEYARQAKEQWGDSAAYKEFEVKTKDRQKDEEQRIMKEFMQIFVEFGTMKELEPTDREAQKQVKKLQDYIIEHFYQCTSEILSGLGIMYAAGGEFTDNIDHAGGNGTAEFVAKAIEIYCKM